jgi:hypothetical protein
MRDRAQREQPRTQEVIYLSYRPVAGEAGSERLYDYSAERIEARWQSGMADMPKRSIDTTRCHRRRIPSAYTSSGRQLRRMAFGLVAIRIRCGSPLHVAET